MGNDTANQVNFQFAPDLLGGSEMPFWEVAASISQKWKTETNLNPVQWYKLEKLLK